MVQIINQPGTLAGRIGRGVGEGLKEQLPKEVERYRLSQGLKSLGEKNFKSPFELAGALYSTPGITPEIAQAVLPYLQARMAQQQRAGQTGQPQSAQGTQSTAQAGAQASDQPAEGQAQAQVNPETGEAELQKILTPESTAALQQTIQRKDPQQLLNEAYELQRNQPFVYPTIEDARKFVEQSEERRISNEQARIDAANRQLSTRNLLKEGMNEAFRAKKVSEALSGELKDILTNKAEDEVARGDLTLQQAINKYSQLGLDLDKSYQNLKTVGSKSWLGKTPGDVRTQLNSIRHTFKEAGPIGLENFRDELKATQGLSDHYANEIAYPVKSNKDVNNYLSSLRGDTVAKRERRQKSGKTESLESEVGRKIGDFIKNSDSLYSIGLRLKSKGLDDRKVMDEIRKEFESEAIKLTKRQQRELETYHTPKRTLGDIYLFTLSGLEPVKEVQ